MERSASVSGLCALIQMWLNKDGCSDWMFFSTQQIMKAVREHNLGLDLRTAAYVCALKKIYIVYREAGITFS